MRHDGHGGKGHLPDPLMISDEFQNWGCHQSDRPESTMF
jgi:hypothetical protein